jgi:hypothetical protein
VRKENDMATTHAAKPNWFAASWFGQFMASTPGRVARIAAGLAIIAGGLVGVGDVAGYIVAAVGLVPLLAGAADKCVVSWLFGAPFDGPLIRAIGRR